MNRVQPPPPPVRLQEDHEYEVEEILDSRLKRNQGQYLVKWTGYDKADATWEPASHLRQARDHIRSFHRNYPDKPGPWGSTSQEAGS